MAENSPVQNFAQLPEAFVSRAALSALVSRAAKAGKLRKLASRLYTRNLQDAPEEIVRRNLWGIVAGYFPGALIADRSALEYDPAPDGSLCIIATRGQRIDLPGHCLRPRRGAPRLESDAPYLGDGLFISSQARACLENMRRSRARGGLCARTFSRRELEEWLESVLRHSGERSLLQLRDQARSIAPALSLQKEFTQLDAIIGALLGTRETKLRAPRALARSQGRPYDPERIARFQKLHAALQKYAPPVRKRPVRGAQGEATLAFFDAYFSNYIEGTKFAVEEAADIVFRGRIPAARPQDAHDVKGVWQIVSDPREMQRTPDRAAELFRLIKARHALVMGGRPHVGPGEFKQMPNRAGGTFFVAPELVEGTLERGFALYRNLKHPFQRALYMMFLAAEVHPFADGNGRIARIMMNAELVAAGEERIIIPTAYRANYIAALKALSHGDESKALILVLDYAQKWTAAVAWKGLQQTKQELENCNAFLDSEEAEDSGRRLRLPQRAG